MVKRRLTVFSASLLFLSVFSTPVWAGGYPISTWSWDNADAWKPDYKMTYVRVHLDPRIPCKGTKVTFKYENPQSGDNVSAGGDNGTFTFNEQSYKVSKFNGAKIPDCNTYAKFYSTNNTYKTGIAEFKTAEGNTYTATFALNFNQPQPSNTDSQEKYPLPWEEDYIKFNQTPAPTAALINEAPEMVYPADGQTIDLEGAYMFKVQPVKGASGYLFGLFQDGVMVYENYRDTKTLSANGEFALWEADPFHANFRAGEIQVWIRAYVNNQWTDARIITVILKPRGGQIASIRPSVSLKPILSQPPVIGTTKVTKVADSSVSAALEKKIEELQVKLEQTERKQAEMESILEKIINWMKSLFPFFN